MKPLASQMIANCMRLRRRDSAGTGISFRAQVFRFGLVGLSNFGISFGAFQGCLWAFSPSETKVASSQAISYAIGILWSFFWNRRFTFSSAGRMLPQAARFIAIQAMFLFVSATLISVGARFVTPTISWLAVMTIITGLNFALTKRWVFK